MRLVRCLSRPGMRRALGGAALGAGAVWLAPAASAAEPAAEPLVLPAAEPEAEPPRFALYLPLESRLSLAKLAPAAKPQSTALGERVCGTPALTAEEGASDGELEVLALASDGSTRSALVSVPRPYAEGSGLTHVLLSAPEGVDPEAAEATAEALWAALEASGRLVVERTADGAPRAARLRSGEPEWQGILAHGPVTATGVTGAVTPRAVTVSVKAPRRGAPRALATLPLVACAPSAWEKGACVRECGFCKFMKGGPCRDAFVAWEGCVEKCREDGADFIEACGQQTLALKACTDEHPEYYGALMADAEDAAAERAAAAAGDEQPARTQPDAAAAAAEQQAS